MAAISRVAEGVYRIRLRGPVGDIGHVNLYLLQLGGDSYALVDTGFFSSYREVADAIASELGEGARVNTIILTHLHYDHYGGARELARLFGAEVLMHEREKLIQNILEELYRGGAKALLSYLNLPDGVVEKLSKVVRREVESYPREVKLVSDGFKIGGWETIHTPGHTPGHLCLFNKTTETLISGDHLLPNETSNIAYYPAEDYNPLLEFLKSLKRVEKLSPKLLLPSHGEVFTNYRERIGLLFRHHVDRLGQVMAGLKEEKTIVGAARHVRWSRGDFDSLPEFDKWLAILETLSHAEFLAYCGVARRRLNHELRYEIVEENFGKVVKRVQEIEKS